MNGAVSGGERRAIGKLRIKPLDARGTRTASSFAGLIIVTISILALSILLFDFQPH